MNGATGLATLLASLSPTLLETEFVFCTFANAQYGDHCNLEPIAAMTEREGLTLVILRSTADEHQLSYETVFQCLSLTVHSSLEHGISANVIAGYYHDHIFVRTEHALKAIAALDEFVC
jgi:hypothetical protein